MTRKLQIDQFYDLLNQAQKKFSLRPFSELNRNNIPRMGVYYFFDINEQRDNKEQLKVIRVGTHAARDKSKTTVYERLNQHFGSKKGLGNHRSSIFRELIGKSLIKKDNIPITNWGQKYKKIDDENEIEFQVSLYLKKLLFIVIEVPGEANKNNDRSFIEKNSIALLSNYEKMENIDKPNNNWLGYDTKNIKICESGLWNSEYVNYESVDQNFLSKLETLILKMKNYNI